MSEKFINQDRTAELWSKVKEYVNDNSGADFTAGNGITIDGDTISVSTPVRDLTQDEYDALPEDEKGNGLIFLPDDSSDDGSSNNSGGSGVPSGFIGMWSGTEIPDGWALCDGQNGTPDLRGRFVLGESDDHVIGETGGSEEVTLTVAQMPMHSHAEMLSNEGTLAYQYGTAKTSNALGTRNRISNSAIESKITSNTYVSTGLEGSSKPHPNMPPYYVLAYIMKL